jgi:perosamine synthetase
MIPIYKPFMPEGIDEEIQKILHSGQLGFGQYGKAFEDSLKDFVGNPYILTVSSYNQAMLIALSCLGLGEEDEVIASPVSCLASNQPFAVKGIKVVWADVDPLTGTMNIDDVRSKISNKTKAIFHNHFCGYVGNIHAINALGKAHNIPVVDDAIEAFGSKYGSKYIGNLVTTITVFSFQTVRLPNTIDGGALAFSDKEMFEKAKLIRDYGINRTKFRTEQGEINPDCDIALEGYGGLMSELNSFIGYKQMGQVADLLHRQKLNAQNWTDTLKQNTEVRPLLLLEGTEPNYWVFGTLCDNKQESINKFRRDGFYATSVHINNNIYSVFGKPVELEGVNRFMDHYVALPSGWWIK